MFPIEATSGQYDTNMISKFNDLVAPCGFDWKLIDILPKVLTAGDIAGTLTAEGAKLLDPTGKLEAGIPMCPPEGDAGTDPILPQQLFFLGSRTSQFPGTLRAGAGISQGDRF